MSMCARTKDPEAGFNVFKTGFASLFCNIFSELLEVSQNTEFCNKFFFIKNFSDLLRDSPPHQTSVASSWQKNQNHNTPFSYD